jgi:hypothetical protein
MMIEQNAIKGLKAIIILWLILLTTSCSTKLFVVNSKNIKVDRTKEFFIIQNPQSNIFAVGIYPSYKTIDQFVMNSRPSIQRIDSLILKELVKNNIRCKIVNEVSRSTNENVFYLRYQDYWSWDFKTYMHLLTISLLDNYGQELSEFVSQGNTAGMHDYPMPSKQVPRLVELILKK